MKKLIALLLVAVICLSFVACNQNTDNEECTDCAKYKDLLELLESEKYKEAIMEIYKLAENGSNDDASGNATETEEDIQFKRKYQSIAEWCKYNNAYSSIENDDGNRLQGREAAKYVYNWLTEHVDYKDCSTYLSNFTIIPDTLSYIERMATDAFGQTTQTIYQQFDYDENGECYELSKLYETFAFLKVFIHGSLILCEYNDNGVLQGASFLSDDGNDDRILGKVQIKYDTNGNIIQADFQTNSGDTWTNTYTYDEKNRLIESNTLLYATRREHKEQYQYDDEGNLIKKFTQDGTYHAFYIDEYWYDDNGRLIQSKQIECDENGIVLDSTYLRFNETQIYTYDEQDRVASIDVELLVGHGDKYTLVYHYEDIYLYKG